MRLFCTRLDCFSIGVRIDGIPSPRETDLCVERNVTYVCSIRSLSRQWELPNQPAAIVTPGHNSSSEGLTGCLLLQEKILKMIVQYISSLTFEFLLMEL